MVIKWHACTNAPRCTRQEMWQMVVIKWSSVIIKWSSVIAYCRGQPWRCDLDAQRHCDGGGDANGGFGRPTTCCSTQREIFRTPSTARASNPLSFRSFQGPLGQTHTHKPRGLTRYGRSVRRPLKRSFRSPSGRPTALQIRPPRSRMYCCHRIRQRSDHTGQHPARAF